MGTDLGWLLEEKKADSWSTPADPQGYFETRNGRGGRVVMVDWWSARSPLTSLFFGSEALFPFRAGIPEDASVEVKAYVCGNFIDDATFAGWLPLEELCLDLWTTETVLLETRVAASFAPAFGSGRELRRQVEDKIGGAHELARLLNQSEVRRVAEPQDWGAQRAHELFRFDSKHLIPVTWREALSGYVGTELWSSLEKLGTLKPVFDYRLVTCIG